MPGTPIEPVPTGTHDELERHFDGLAPASAEADWARAIVYDGLFAPSSRTRRSGLERDEEVRPPSGARFGRFVLERQLGAGGMGAVYRAHDLELDRKVALKILHTSSPGHIARQQQLREARALAQLSHPNVVEVFAIGTCDERLFIATALVEGLTLRQWVHERQPSIDAIVLAYRQAGDGLVAAHEAGIVHRDFKPDNAMIGTDGRVRVLDFGIARLHALAQSKQQTEDPAVGRTGDEQAVDSRTRTGSIAGTPLYMAPEQMDGAPATPLCDQYSFCAALYEALSGHPPFRGRTLGELRENMRGGAPPPLPRAVPARIARTIARGLQTDPSRRYPTLALLLGDLHRSARWRGAAILVPAALAVLAVEQVSRSDSEPSCTGAEESIAEIWNPDVRQTVIARAQADAASYTDEIDAYVGRLAGTFQDVCEASLAAPSPDLDHQMACLDVARRGLQSVVDTLTSDRASASRSPRVAITTLVPPELCRDSTYLQRNVPLPPPPEQRGVVEGLRARAAKLSAVHRGGSWKVGLVQVQELLERAQATSYEPLIAELLEQRGVLHAQASQAAAAAGDLEQAYFLARKHDHTIIALRASSFLAYVQATALANPEAGRRWAQYAMSELRRLGDSPLEIQVRTLIGNMEMVLGAPDEAVAHLERALALLERYVPDDHVQMAQALNNLAAPLGMLGDLERAGTLLERSRERWRAADVAHPNRIDAIVNLANVRDLQDRDAEAEALYQEALGALEAADTLDVERHASVLYNLGDLVAETDPQGALQHYERGLEQLEPLLGDSHPELIYFLNGIAESHLALGHTGAANAAALRAAALAELHPEPAAVAGRAHLLAGEALLRSGGVQRAVPHLEQAVELLQSAPEEEERLARAEQQLRRALARARRG